ncbi:MAG: glycerol-3-phosphate acyltransferase [Dehalococcoidales bacterium]
MSEALAVIIGYLLGTIPTAYIVTRLWVGKDIRTLGGGNVGFMNVFREVGIAPALIVVTTDIAKGVIAVVIAKYGLNAADSFVLISGLASVIGHNWMPWLRFTGGKGMATAIGIIIASLIAYGYPLQLGIFFVIIIIPLAITKNVPLAMALALIALPFMVWISTQSALATTMAALLFLISFIKFLPTAVLAIKNTKRKRDLIFDTIKAKSKEEKPK